MFQNTQPRQAEDHCETEPSNERNAPVPGSSLPSSPAALSLSDREDGATSPQQFIDILAIEDDCNYFRFVEKLLMASRCCGFRITQAKSLAEASEILSSTKPGVILLDLTLPDGQGLGILSDVRTWSRNAPIIVLTGNDDEVTGLKAVSMGAQDYLVKQRVSVDSMVRCILYAAERKRFEDSMARMAMVKDFAGTLAHDLQVPMIGADNVFEALLANRFGDIPPNLSSALNELKANNKRQLMLVQKLLEVYRYEAINSPLERVDVDIRSLIETCAQSMLVQLRPAFSIRRILPDEMAPIQGDRKALCRLLCNLFENAIKFSDGTEDVTVHAETVGTTTSIHIHNNGPVIPQDVQLRIFQSFWQGVPGKSYVAKTGLGLYLCHRIVTLHGGTITCTSAQGQGTTITVNLPTVA